jgi:DnaJ domain
MAAPPRLPNLSDSHAMNHYEILEVSSKASPAVIKAAYKSLMQRYHPDKNNNDSASAQRTTQLVQAYEVLSDDARRAAYDLQMNARAANYSAPLQEASRSLHRQSHFAQSKAHPTANSYWIIWLLIIGTMAVAMWFLLRPAPAATSGAVSGKRPAGQDKSANPPTDTPSVDAVNNQAPIASVMLLQGLEVTLIDAENLPAGTAKILKIPVLRLGSSTSDGKKLVWYADDHKELLRQNIEIKLMRAKSAQLIEADGTKYMQDLVLQAISEMATVHKPEMAEQAYKIEIDLPNSFTVGLYDKKQLQIAPLR